MDEVIVKCYGKENTWKTRQAAINFFLDGIACSDGCERDRYVNIYLQLTNNYKYCSDECEDFMQI